MLVKAIKQREFWSPLEQVEGKVLPPLVLWMLGVPGGICLLLWLFFFRG